MTIITKSYDTAQSNQTPGYDYGQTQAQPMPDPYRPGVSSSAPPQTAPNPIYPTTGQSTEQFPMDRYEEVATKLAIMKMAMDIAARTGDHWSTVYDIMVAKVLA